MHRKLRKTLRRSAAPIRGVELLEDRSLPSAGGLLSLSSLSQAPLLLAPLMQTTITAPQTLPGSSPAAATTVAVGLPTADIAATANDLLTSVVGSLSTVPTTAANVTNATTNPLTTVLGNLPSAIPPALSPPATAGNIATAASEALPVATTTANQAAPVVDNTVSPTIDDLTQLVVSPVANLTAPIVNTIAATTSDLTAPITAIATPVTSTIATVASAVTPVMSDLSAVLGNVAPLVNDVAAPITSAVAAIDTLTAPVAAITSPLVQDLATVVNQTAPLVSSLTTPILSTVTPLVDDLTAPVVAVADPLLTSVSSTLNAALAPTLTTVTNVLPAITPILGDVTSITNAVTADVTAILPATTGLLSTVSSLTTTSLTELAPVVNGLTSTVQPLTGAVTSLVDTVVTDVSSSVPMVGPAVGGIVPNGTGTVGTVLSDTSATTGDVSVTANPGNLPGAAQLGNDNLTVNAGTGAALVGAQVSASTNNIPAVVTSTPGNSLPGATLQIVLNDAKGEAVSGIENPGANLTDLVLPHPIGSGGMLDEFQAGAGNFAAFSAVFADPLMHDAGAGGNELMLSLPIGQASNGPEGPRTASGEDVPPATVDSNGTDQVRLAMPEETNYLAAGPAFNLANVDVQNFLAQIDRLGREMVLNGMGLYPWLIALAIGAVALEYRRRQQRRRARGVALALADDVGLAWWLGPAGLSLRDNDE